MRSTFILNLQVLNVKPFYPIALTFNMIASSHFCGNLPAQRIRGTWGTSLHLLSFLLAHRWPLALYLCSSTTASNVHIHHFPHSDR